VNQAADLGIASVLAALTEEGLVTSTVTIQRFNTAVKGPTGILDKSNESGWVNLADHVDLPAMVAADIYMTNVTRSTERRLDSTIGEVDSLHVLFTDLFPGIQKKDRAVITRPNGVPVEAFDVIGVECDSQAVMTRLEVRRYK